MYNLYALSVIGWASGLVCPDWSEPATCQRQVCATIPLIYISEVAEIIFASFFVVILSLICIAYL